MSLPQTQVIPSTITGRQSLDIKVTSGDALRVFYGNRYRLNNARTADLQEGDTRSDLDITVPTNGLRTLRGIVLDAVDGHPLEHGKVVLLDPVDDTELRTTELSEDGSFALNYVADGSYLIEIRATADNHGRSGAGYEPMKTELLVQNDMPDLKYALNAAKR